MKFYISVCLLSITATSFAECPISMDEDKLIECLMIEGSGANYQDWLAQYNEPADSNNRLVSKITGKDVRQLKPAAGSNNQ